MPLSSLKGAIVMIKRVQRMREAIHLRCCCWGGAAGLAAAAIRQSNSITPRDDISVCIVEKAQKSALTFSGAVF